MKLADKNKCCGCSACSAVCPMSAIKMEYDEEFFLYPIVDTEKCIDCHKCESVCPIINKNDIKIETHNLEVVQGFIKDDHKHRESASGGAASVISELFIKDGGCIFGSSYYDGFRKAKYIKAETAEQLQKLKGSKYIETEKNDIFLQVKEELIKGRKVLFIGLPCDIGGLKYFLQKEYSNLYTCELICHGPMPQQIQTEYIDNLEIKYNSKVSMFNSRYNKEGKEASHIRVDFKNGKSHIKPLWDSDYGYAFAIASRRSCYECSFKGDERIADISVGDSWSATDGFGDKKGVSIIYAHTEKGIDMVNKIIETGHFEWQKLEYEQIKNDNPAIYKSLPLDKNRTIFLSTFRKAGLKKANFSSRSIIGKIKYILKNV